LSPPRRSKWTDKQACQLLLGIGAYGRDWFVRKTGRSIAAVMAKARAQYGSGSLTRGTWSLKMACDETGYHRSQLFRAQSALGQKWRRTSARGRYIISEEQLRELTDWLEHDYWSARKGLYNCLWCTTTARPVYSIGLCRSCYDAYRRRSRALGLPQGLSEQRLLMIGLRESGIGDGPLWRPVLARLEMGMALDYRQLTTIGRLAQAVAAGATGAPRDGD
jgi:hypothetical protein